MGFKSIPHLSLLVAVIFSFCLPIAYGQETILLPEPTDVPPPAVLKNRKHESKYKDGKIKTVRHVNHMSDNSLVYHGVYIEYYPSGKKFTEGRYEKGDQVGAWKYWFENEQEAKTVSYKNGLPNGSWDVYREDGTKQYQRGFKQGKRDGKWIAYSEDGKSILGEEAYAQGKPSGVWNYWFANGKKKSEISFKQGKRDGILRNWNKEGKLIYEIGFKDGKRDGKATSWPEDGGKPKVYFYKNNKRVKE